MKVVALTNSHIAAIPYSGNAPDAAGAFLLHTSNPVSSPMLKEDTTRIARALKKQTAPVAPAANNGKTCKQDWRMSPDVSVTNRHERVDVAEESLIPNLDGWDMKSAADRPVSFNFFLLDAPTQKAVPTYIPPHTTVTAIVLPGKKKLTYHPEERAGANAL